MKTLLTIALLTSITFANDKTSENLFWANLKVLDYSTNKVLDEIQSLDKTLLKVKLSKQFKLNLIESNVSALITTYKLGVK
mgnify:FL=1|tara:strand:- start:372 stop:614 length:243 start_codon:yes stop_codon:yes gene_type:complete